MKRIPFSLKILDTCLPDYFQGFSGPVISFPVDARMTYSELIAKLTDDDAWPSNADIEDIRAAVIDLTGSAHTAGSKPYSDTGPDEAPDGWFVSRHPNIEDMWFVIDKRDGEVLSSWPTQKEALCDAWEETASDVPTEIYAYFGIELDWPDGYTTWRRKDNDNAWYWEDELGVDEGDFDTEFEAKVAAWRHKINQKPDVWSAGEIDYEEEGDCLPHADIHHHPLDGQPHLGKIRVFGGDEDDACQLQQHIIHLLNEHTK